MILSSRNISYSVESLQLEGLARLEPFILGYLNGDTQVFPFQIPMTVEEAKPKVSKRKRNNPLKNGIDVDDLIGEEGEQEE